MNRPDAALRYANTYLVLLREFALMRGWRFWAMLAAVLANAFVHPIPYLLIAEILRNTQSGASGVTLGWRSLSLTLPPDAAILAVFLAGSTIILFSYGVSRRVNAEIVAWQGEMFWRIMASAGRFARWDRTLELDSPLQPAAVTSRIDSALRGAFPIGRLIETGSRDFVMILALGAMLIWQDARGTAVLAMLSLLFLPAYAVALARLVRMQTKSNAQLVRLRQPMTGLLRSAVTTQAGRGLDPASVPPAATRLLAQGFGSQSLLLNEQNAVVVVAGLHVFAAFYGVFLSEGKSLAALPASKLSFLFFAVLLLRSLTGLIGLISRLSRGYDRLSQLRELLYPAPKPMPAAGHQDFGRFSLRPPGAITGERLLGPGDCIVFVAPEFSFAFQLLPLSNALLPRFTPGPGIVRSIPLLGPGDLTLLLSGEVIAGQREPLPLPVIGTVALQPDPVDMARVPVLALTQAAWQKLASDGALAAAGAKHLLVLTVPGQTVPPDAPAGALIVISDGQRLVVAGDAAAIANWQLARAPRPASRPGTGEDDDEPGDI